jgi:chaperonin cofactor prefoldin
VSDTDDADKTQDLRARLKQFAQPLVDSIDSRLRDQIDTRVDERVEASLSARLSVIERAIADLDRELRELKERLEP